MMLIRFDFQNALLMERSFEIKESTMRTIQTKIFYDALNYFGFGFDFGFCSQDCQLQ